jgi:hypothetical protein
MGVVLLKCWLSSWLPCVSLRVLTPVVAFYSKRLLRSHCAPGPDRWPQGSCNLCRRGTLAKNSQWWYWWPDECHVTSSCHIAPMRDIVRVDGSPSTVAALLHRGVRSPHTVACPLHMSGRSAPYYIVRSPSCRVNVLYAFNACHTLHMDCHIRT